MKKKVIDILINQLSDYCDNNENCKHCACFIYNQPCLSSALKHYQSTPNKILEYLYSLDEGLESFNDD